VDERISNTLKELFERTRYLLEQGEQILNERRRISARDKIYDKSFDKSGIDGNGKDETCHTSPLWKWNYCTTNCKCYAGEGDCDSNDDCHTGYCAFDVGEKYGQDSRMDVCEEK
jgi:hypothetical protein